MCSAHNRIARVGGYSPMQWALGRDVEDGNSDLSTWSAAADPTSQMHRNLQLRLDTEDLYRRMQAEAKISRAINSRPSPNVQYIPGDLIYYRRVKVTRDTTAHSDVDLNAGRRFRWYGPARVLAAETRLQDDGEGRRAGNVVWLIANGRLKKAHTSQLRHASERERLIAEANPAPTLPWTFTSLGTLLSPGQYEDLMQDEHERLQRPRGKVRGRSESRGPPRCSLWPQSPQIRRKS